MLVDTAKILATNINAMTDEQTKELAIKEVTRSFKETSARWTLRKFQKRRNPEIAKDRYKTGFKYLDYNLGGGIPTASIITITGVPSVGKSTFCLQMAKNFAMNNLPVLYINYEMDGDMFVSKLIAQEYFIKTGMNQDTSINGIGLVNPQLWKPGEDAFRGNLRLSEKQWEESENIARELEKKLADNLIPIDCTLAPLTIDEIYCQVENYVRAFNKSPIVIIDYLHMIAPPLDESGRPVLSNDKEVIDYNIRGARKIASKFGCSVVLVSAMTKQSFNDEISMTSISGSGNILYASDVIIALNYGMIKDKNFNLEYEKGLSPRRVKATVLKNKWFLSDSIKLDYYSRFDYFDDNATKNGWKETSLCGEATVEEVEGLQQSGSFTANLPTSAKAIEGK